MNKQTNSNINLSSNYGKSLLRKHRNKGINDMSVKNVIQRYKEIELESQKSVSSKKANTKIQTLIVSSDMIIHFDKIQLNLLNKTNCIYTFTNRPYKQINKNLNNIYTISKSAFLNMSSIISKPIVLINPNLIKITLFYY